MKQSRILLATVLLTLMLSGCSADPADPAVPKTGELQSEFADIGLALAEFQETENAQAKGWIRLEDTGIDNPVFQGQDNEFYLRLGDDGAYSIWGCYYADFECRLTDELSRCTIIYGHSSLNDETEGERFTELKHWQFCGGSSVFLLCHWWQGVCGHDLFSGLLAQLLAVSVRKPHRSRL